MKYLVPQLSQNTANLQLLEDFAAVPRTFCARLRVEALAAELCSGEQTCPALSPSGPVCLSRPAITQPAHLAIIPPHEGIPSTSVCRTSGRAFLCILSEFRSSKTAATSSALTQSYPQPQRAVNGLRRHEEERDRGRWPWHSRVSPSHPRLSSAFRIRTPGTREVFISTHSKIYTNANFTNEHFNRFVSFDCLSSALEMAESEASFPES